MNDYPIVTDENEVPRAPVPPSLVTVTRVVYALHALSILIGVFAAAFSDINDGADERHHEFFELFAVRSIKAAAGKQGPCEV